MKLQALSILTGLLLVAITNNALAGKPWELPWEERWEQEKESAWSASTSGIVVGIRFSTPQCNVRYISLTGNLLNTSKPSTHENFILRVDRRAKFYPTKFTYQSDLLTGSLVFKTEDMTELLQDIKEGETLRIKHLNKIYEINLFFSSNSLNAAEQHCLKPIIEQKTKESYFD